MNTTTDQYHIDQTLGGDANAFGELVGRYQDYVYTIVVRMIRNKEEAQEIVQDTFVKAYQSLANYRGEAKFSSWLYTIAYRKTLDRIKQQKRMVDSDTLDYCNEGDLGDVTNALDFMMMEERKAVIKKAIESLAPDVAAIITYYYYEELSVKEIVEITGLGADNIKVKLFRGRKKLFTLLQQSILPEIQNGYGTV
ncbi:MAG: sigma-70 family RNA polymerase sigma factor [Gilvibacter sp.]